MHDQETGNLERKIFCMRVRAGRQPHSGDRLCEFSDLRSDTNPTSSIHERQPREKRRGDWSDGWRCALPSPNLSTRWTQCRNFRVQARRSDHPTVLEVFGSGTSSQGRLHEVAWSSYQRNSLSLCDRMASSNTPASQATMKVSCNLVAAIQAGWKLPSSLSAGGWTRTVTMSWSRCAHMRRIECGNVSARRRFDRSALAVGYSVVL